MEPSGKKTGLLAKGVYGLCRNPMYFGMIMMFLGSSHIITPDRLVFYAVHIVCIMYGVHREEAKMRKEWADFDQYVKTVPNSYLPNFARLFG